MAPGYTVLNLLGEGGMGQVFRAHQVALNRYVALKMLGPELENEGAPRERFRREVKILSQLSHPHIVKVFDFGVLAGRPFFTMELVEGRSLDQLLKEEGPLEASRFRLVMTQLLDALVYLHEKGIRHRDLKPRNIILARDDHVVLVDFGLATATSSRRLTLSDEVVGTAAYLAPEIVEGEEAGSPQDIWSLGLVAYEMLTGSRLFSAPTPIGLAALIAGFDPSSLRMGPSPVAAGYRDLIGACLAREPGDRPTARELLVRFQDPRAPSTANRSLPATAPSTAGSVQAMSILLMVTFVIGLWISLHGTRSPLPPVPVMVPASPDQTGVTDLARLEEIRQKLAEIWKLLDWDRAAVGPGGGVLRASRDPITLAMQAPPGAAPSIFRALVLLDESLTILLAGRIEGDVWFDLADAGREVLMQVSWCRGFEEGSSFRNPLVRLQQMLPSVGVHPAATCFRRGLEAHIRHHEFSTGPRKLEEAEAMRSCAELLESQDPLRSSTPRELIATLVYYHLAATYSWTAHRDYAFLGAVKPPDLGARMQQRLISLGPRILREVPRERSDLRARALDVLSRHTIQRLRDSIPGAPTGESTREMSRLLLECMRNGEIPGSAEALQILESAVHR